MAVLEIGEKILREPARPLSKEEILSAKTEGFIQSLIFSMRKAPGVGLAAPQVGAPIQIIALEDKSEYHNYLTKQQLIERERKEFPLTIVINPVLYIEDAEVAEFFEGCLSVPDMIGIVPRAKSVRVEGLNERAEPIVIHATGWHARILQHEIDHLKGIIYTDKADKKTLMTQENFRRLWKNKPISEVKKEFGS